MGLGRAGCERAVSRAPRLRLRFALLAAAVLGSFAAGELAVRLLDPEVAYAYRGQRVRADYYADSELTEFTLRRNYSGRQISSAVPVDSETTTNSLGWRDAEPDGRPLVPVFGDSIVFGYLLADGDTIPDALERLAGGAIDFANLGFTAGRSPDSYAVYLRHHAELKGRVTVVVLFENDLADAAKNRYVDGSGRDVDFATCSRVICDRLVIRGGSRFDLVTEDDWVRRRVPVALLETIKRSHLIGLARDRVSATRHRARGDDGPRPASSAGEAVPVAAPRIIRALEEIDALAGRLIVVTIGNAEFYEPVRRLARERALTLVELPLFDADDRFAGDGHFNAKGAARAAAMIHESLVTSGALGTLEPVV